MTEILHWKDVNWTDLERIEARCYAANADNEWVPWSIWQSWPIAYRDRIEFRVKPNEVKAPTSAGVLMTAAEASEWLRADAQRAVFDTSPKPSIWWRGDLGTTLRYTLPEQLSYRRLVPETAPTDWQSKAEAYRKDTINAHAALVETQREIAQLREDALRTDMILQALDDVTQRMQRLHEELEVRDGK